MKANQLTGPLIADRGGVFPSVEVKETETRSARQAVAGLDDGGRCEDVAHVFACETEPRQDKTGFGKSMEQ